MRGHSRSFVKNRTITDYLLFPFEKSWFTCERCMEHQIGTEFVGFRDDTRHYDWCKACRLKYAWPVTDYYVRNNMRQGTTIPATAKWPEDILRLAKLRIQLMRLRRNHEDNQRHRATVLR